MLFRDKAPVPILEIDRQVYSAKNSTISKSKPRTSTSSDFELESRRPFEIPPYAMQGIRAIRFIIRRQLKEVGKVARGNRAKDWTTRGRHAMLETGYEDHHG